MGKQSGLGAGCYVDGVDLSGDIGSLQRINSARGVLPLTGIDKSAFERSHSFRDGGFEFQAWMNAAAGQAHPTLANYPSAERIATYLHRQTIGAPAAAMVCKQFSYNGSRPDDGSLTWSVVAESNRFGVEWGNLLTAGKRTDTAATSPATGVDFEAATAFGLQAYLHVFSFTGTDVTIKLQESSDNGAGDAFADVSGGAFTAVTAGPTKERIQTTRTLAVERYLRVVTTTSGGFSNLVFGVIVKKNTVLTNF